MRSGAGGGQPDNPIQPAAADPFGLLAVRRRAGGDRRRRILHALRPRADRRQPQSRRDRDFAPTRGRERHRPEALPQRRRAGSGRRTGRRGAGRVRRRFLLAESRPGFRRGGQGGHGSGPQTRLPARRRIMPTIWSPPRCKRRRCAVRAIPVVASIGRRPARVDDRRRLAPRPAA